MVVGCLGQAENSTVDIYRAENPSSENIAPFF
jgi:hypothetical protein